MKLKFVLVPLVVLGFAVGSYADESKTKWISPTKKVCKANGGEMIVGDTICEGSWSNAKEICSASGGRLATIDELKKVVTDCGGEVTESVLSEFAKENGENSSYQSCYTEKGFSSQTYWSSTTYASYTSHAWAVGFYYGRTYDGDKSYSYGVRCVRAGQ